MIKKEKDKFVGIQISPISFIDEGIDNVLDTLQKRVGVNVLLIGTVSWLGLKSGRSVSWEIDGWPDHGIPEPFSMKGGAYFDPDPKFYNKTFIKNFKAQDKEMKNKDILKSKAIISEKIGKEVVDFAYPNGEFTPSSEKLLNECAFKTSVVVDYSHLSSNFNPYKISRIPISSIDDRYRFFIKLYGFWPPFIYKKLVTNI